MPQQESSLTELLMITGMSGAGRSTTIKALEDLGWYVVDNLPPSLLPSLVDLARATQLDPGADADADPVVDIGHLAVAVDVRGRRFFDQLDAALAAIKERGQTYRLLYLDASDADLVRRFESVRRPHPLQGHGRLLDAIQKERLRLAELRSMADVIVDSSNLNVHQLSAKINQVFSGDADPELRVTVMSFGFKYGIPLDADHVADVRFLPNPYWVPELRPHTGLSAEVSDYVLGQPSAGEFLADYLRTLRVVLAGYEREHKRYATVAIGCTGGKHRSVAMSEALAAALTEAGLQASTVHRDVGRE